MTNPMPAPNPPTQNSRLATLPGRRESSPRDLRLLCTLHRRLERITRAYVAITEAIIRRVA
jgi:hypothetical protein